MPPSSVSGTAQQAERLLRDCKDEKRRRWRNCLYSQKDGGTLVLCSRSFQYSFKGNRMNAPLKHVLFLTTLLVLAVSTAQAADTWQYVGAAGFTAGEAYDISLALDKSGTPYIAYRDNATSKVNVMRFDGTNWVQVGTAGFSSGVAYYPSLALDSSGRPYVAYRDNANYEKVSVMRFNGTAWEQVGKAGFSAGGVDTISLALDSSGKPYVAYMDWANSGKASVMRFDGTNWVQVGVAGFSASMASSGTSLPTFLYPTIALDSSDTAYVAYYTTEGNRYNTNVMRFDGTNWVQVGSADFFSAGKAGYPSLALNSSGTPYVAYMDCGSINKASVMRFDGTNWVQVGTAGFSSGVAYYPSLALDSSGTPYVAYPDGANNSKASVMRFNGTNWEQVGMAGFSAGEVSYNRLALDSDGTPYVAYADLANGRKASVMKFAPADLTPVLTPVYQLLLKK